jgi:hypothetical protein
MVDRERSHHGDPRQHDPGLKRLLTYTFVALAVALLAAFVAVSLVIHFFDSP